MSVIGKKPYINIIIDELLEDEAGGGVEVLTDLSYLVNETDQIEATPIDFTDPLEEIYNYEHLGQVCSVTYAALKMNEGTIRNGFLIVTPNHTAFFSFGKNEENMECYDLVWTEYERSYKTVNESLDANEFRREIALQGGSGGGGSSGGVKLYKHTLTLTGSVTDDIVLVNLSDASITSMSSLTNDKTILSIYSKGTNKSLMLGLASQGIPALITVGESGVTKYCNLVIMNVPTITQDVIVEL